jgi:hypothetical protein
MPAFLLYTLKVGCLKAVDTINPDDPADSEDHFTSFIKDKG